MNISSSKTIFLIAFVTVFFLIIHTALGSISVHIIDNVENYTKNQNMTGMIKIEYDETIKNLSKMIVNIDNLTVKSFYLTSYIQEPSSYKKQDFSYKIIGEGKLIWEQLSNEHFTFIVTTEGRCNSGSNYCTIYDYCDSDPCDFSLSFNYPGTKIVNKLEGLKFIYAADLSINLPSEDYIEGSVKWSVVTNNSNVLATMRMACGNEWYENYASASHDGWVRKALDPSSPNWYPVGSAGKETNIENFDDKSLDENRNLYDGGPGGIYRDGVYQDYEEDVTWDGDTGYIEIKNYVADSEYNITYLPPNGPRVCAYTTASVTNTHNWKNETDPEQATVEYGTPYVKYYGLNDLPPVPSCPETCIQRTADNYYATVIDNPNVQISSSFNNTDLKVTATTDSKEFPNNHTINFNFEDLELKTPLESGIHNLTASVFFGNDLLAKETIYFTVCSDLDKDGYCNDSEGGNDCNDKNSKIYPGAEETCNGLDDDCDGQIDEDFYKPGSKLGKECNNWTGSVCKGVFVCTRDGNNVTCSGKYEPGELPEICDDGLDNDCDGRIDEDIEIQDGDIVEACICRNGETKTCGNNIGECKEGYRICVNHEWTDCLNNVGPVKEKCNRLDDDCDSIIDNVNGGKSVEETNCGCLDDNLPEPETCNDIDDDCDGQIDEGIKCCSEGSERKCGKNIGECKEGKQTCIDGSWGLCIGSKDPEEEVCFNNLDDDCDGKIDENCKVSTTCKNGIKDLNEDGIDCGRVCGKSCQEGISIPWIILSVIGIIIIIITGIWGLKSSR